uniref:Transmembrane protein 255B-like n=1 Tax=Oryzias melastigma TaxID=30732 RepID=A0A3B3BBF1_ORYME
DIYNIVQQKQGSGAGLLSSSPMVTPPQRKQRLQIKIKYGFLRHLDFCIHLFCVNSSCFLVSLLLLQLTAAIVFLSLGIITSFFCLLIDGVCIVLNMDIRPLNAGRCQYYSSGRSYIYENFFATVSCQNLKESCSLTVRSGTCYCCDLYDCANGGYLSNYYEFVGVESCEDVFTLYVFIWVLAGLNLVAFFTGILTTAVLGSIKSVNAYKSFCYLSFSGVVGFPSMLFDLIQPNPVPYQSLPHIPQHIRCVH